MTAWNLQNSRVERFVHFLSDVVGREAAIKMYYKFDGLPDKVLETFDECLYEEMVARGYFNEKG